MKKYPRHVAIIPDWNRTWAKSKGYSNPVEWTLEGEKRVAEIVEYVFKKTPIDVITVWGLSTENMKNRNEVEKQFLFRLFWDVGNEQRKLMKAKKINFKRVGSEEWLPKELVKHFKSLEKEFSFEESNKRLVVAINYGWRDEIARGVKRLAKRKEIDKLSSGEIEDLLTKKYLDFAHLPQVDLVIRTKGHLARRLSWFMLWWIGYAELYFAPQMMPEFGVKEFKEALSWFEQVVRYRNFGK